MKRLAASLCLAALLIGQGANASCPCWTPKPSAHPPLAVALVKPVTHLAASRPVIHYRPAVYSPPCSSHTTAYLLAGFAAATALAICTANHHDRTVYVPAAPPARTGCK